MNINWIWYLGLGYLLGSIPFALVIGKLFYKTDVRNFGSGNLGGTNAGRVLGKKAGISVIVFDVVKVVIRYLQGSAVGKPLRQCLDFCYQHPFLPSRVRGI